MKCSILAVLLLSSLVSCGKKAPPEKPQAAQNQTLEYKDIQNQKAN